MTAIKQLLTDAELERAAAGGTEARALFKRMRNADLWVAEVALTFGALAAGGLVPLFAPTTATQRIKIRELVLSGEGTAFSGGGGNRLVSVTDGASVWTAITAALLGAPVATRWGGTGIPYPATPAHLSAQSVAGQNVRALYTGGSADYTAGALKLIATYEITSE